MAVSISTEIPEAAAERLASSIWVNSVAKSGCPRRRTPSDHDRVDVLAGLLHDIDDVPVAVVRVGKTVDPQGHRAPGPNPAS